MRRLWLGIIYNNLYEDVGTGPVGHSPCRMQVFGMYWLLVGFTDTWSEPDTARGSGFVNSGRDLDYRNQATIGCR